MPNNRHGRRNSGLALYHCCWAWEISLPQRICIWFFTFSTPSLIRTRWRPWFSSSSNKPWIFFLVLSWSSGPDIIYLLSRSTRSVLKCNYSFSRKYRSDKCLSYNFWNNSDKYVCASQLQGWKTLLFPNLHTSMRHPLSRKMRCQLEWFGSKHPPYRWAFNALLQTGE